MRRAGRRRATRVLAACCCVLALLGPACPAVAQDLPPPAGRVDLVLSHEQSRGLYREATATRIRQTSLTLRYRGGGWSAEVQLPWLEVDSAGGSGGLPDAAVAGRSREQGLGDVWLKGSVTLRELEASSTGIDLVAKLKTPAGDMARGLGSGGTDLALQLDAVRALGATVLFGHLGRRWTGDVQGYAPYRNPWYAQLGAQRALTPVFEWGLYADLREPLGRLGPLGEATAYAAWRQGRQRWQLHLSRGWRHASADMALGLTWRLRY